MAAFHSGLYKLARHNPEIPVVPVTLRDLGRPQWARPIGARCR